MTCPDRSARTAFCPADQLGYSAVRLLDPADKSRVLGTISAEALRARGPVKRVHVAPLVEPKRAPLPEVPQMGRRKREVEA